MTGPDTPTDRIRGAVLEIVAVGGDLGEAVADALVAAAEELGSVEALVVGRPGSWEASHVRALAGSASTPDSPLGMWK